MIEEIRKLSLAALGTAATTYDKVAELINSMVVKGRISVEEGKILSEQLKKDLITKAEEAKVKATGKIDDIKPINKQELNDIIKELNLATKTDIQDLKMKISELEEKINNK